MGPKAGKRSCISPGSAPSCEDERMSGNSAKGSVLSSLGKARSFVTTHWMLVGSCSSCRLLARRNFLDKVFLESLELAGAPKAVKGRLSVSDEWASEPNSSPLLVGCARAALSSV